MTNNAEEIRREGPEGPPAAVEPNPPADAFYEGAERRLMWMVVGLAAIGVAALAMINGPVVGFICGCIVAGANARWLHRTVAEATHALEVKAVAGQAGKASTALLAFGLVLRLLLVTAIGYVIVKSTIQSFYGYVGGLFVPILAVFVEAIYEAWVAVRRGY